MIKETYIKINKDGYLVKVHKIFILEASSHIRSRVAHILEYPNGSMEQISFLEFSQMKNPE